MLQELAQRAKTVVAGRADQFFIEGEYGIGKTSTAKVAQLQIKQLYELYPIYASLGGVKTLDEVAEAVLRAAVVAGGAETSGTLEKLGEFLGRYGAKLKMPGLEISLEALKKSAPELASPFGLLGFLNEWNRTAGSRGISLVMDEINGIANEPRFSQFLKSFVEINVLSDRPMPLLLILCGTAGRRMEMIRQHQPMDRLFRIIGLRPLTLEDSHAFFMKAFNSVNISADHNALWELSVAGQGFPRMMQLLGEAAYECDQDGIIDLADVNQAILRAAEEVGKRYVDQQVIKALRSPEYKAILNKLVDVDNGLDGFLDADLRPLLTESESKKLPSFLQRMKKLNVLRAGEEKGRYYFTTAMTWVYLFSRFRGPAHAAAQYKGYST
ncbi:MAG: hypothetical protein SFV54_01870 [Bryobacteraceae bacterium]|nr:hypothetical protein [Bryobacteraceae bacterium]